MEHRVFAASCPEYRSEEVRAAVARMMEAYGGVSRFLQKGKRVLIKPNLLLAREPEGATTTHPEIVAAVAAMFTEAGGIVTIADSPGGLYNPMVLSHVYRQCGMTDAARRAGARLNTDCSSCKVKYEGERPWEFEIITPVLDADVVISIGKMKTHMLTYFTGAVKNLYGTVPGLTKRSYHSALPGRQAFCRMLVDLCLCVSPDLSIIDGIEGMDGRGPSGGRPRKAGFLIASESAFAADLAAMHLCGLKSDRAPVHVYAAARGLVPEKAERLQWRGDPVAPLAEPFAPAVGKSSRSESVISRLPSGMRQPLRRVLIPAPHVGDRCVGCGVCARSCPTNAIVIRGGKAEIRAHDCIRCYCCHELCRIKAVVI